MYRLLTIKPTAIQNFRYVLWVEDAIGASSTMHSCCRLESKLLRLDKCKVFNTQQPQHRGTSIMTKTPTCEDQASMAQGSVLTANANNAAALKPIRKQSTTTTNAETVKESNQKRSRKPRYAKFVELLEVTDLAASERKSRVKRLKAKKLQEFIIKTQQQILEKRSRVEKSQKAKASKVSAATVTQQPIEYQKFDIEALDSTIFAEGSCDDKPLIFLGQEESIHNTTQVLDNPEEVQNILKSFNNFRDIIETMEYEGQESYADIDTYRLSANKVSENGKLADPFEVIEPYITPDVIRPEPTIMPIPPVAKAKPRFKSKVHNNEEQERLAKERALRINLNIYVNVCISTGSVNRALSTILTYRQRAKKSTHHYNKSLITIDLYNILLHGYAEKGAFERVKDIIAFIKEDELEFNEQTFAAVFECLGQMESNELIDAEIKSFIEKSQQMGFTLHQIMDRSKFVANQRDTVLSAIQRIQPDFIPKYTPPELGYNNKLLNDLNQSVLPVTECEPENNAVADCKIMNSKRGYSKEELEQKAREQLKIELDSCVTIKSIEKSMQYTNAEYCRGKLKEMEALWRSQIHSAIIRDMNILKTQIRFKPSGYMTYYTYLKALDHSIYADILLKEIYKLGEGSETFSYTVGQLYKELGHKIQLRYNIEHKKQNGILTKMGEVYSSYCDYWANAETNDNTRQIWQRLVHKSRSSGPSMDINELTWPTNVLTGIGRFLYNILMRDIKIDAYVMRQQTKAKQNLLPAFYTLFRNQGRLLKEEVKPHPVLARLLRASRQKTLTFDSNLVPMLCPPQPWSTPYNGGYLLNKSDLIRLPYQAIQQWERINVANPQHLYPALDALNQLASVPWRVNTDILDVIIEVFQNGGNDKLDVPRPPNSLPPLPALPKDVSVTSAERAKLFIKKLGYRRKQAEMYSLWCDSLYRLSLANHYRNKVFWLPHNMDFRGRVYPVPPHLNHMGSDLARSMLIFDQPQPLGVDGFSWLKLHCINLTGLKKRDSIRERLLYAEDVIEEMLDSADNPLTGRMWWSKSDEPWQTLACCMEIAKVHRSPNPEEYLSHFPIHQDGSCNGLQHYAALGRDRAGAVSVNLTPSKVPQDVYSLVAGLVEKARQHDAENGLHVAQALKGFVLRKVIKQTVMTTVYGVTRYGARLQIARQLKDIDDFPKDWVWPASTYLTTKTFESLCEMFTSTREIQDWFTECARLISGVCSQNVEWITPLGLPVVQPYSRQEHKQNARAGTHISELMSMDLYERPNVMKQKNAFPPNFIHSLDSSHMMLTSLFCERQGLTFISVHDCFWTHANTVPDLNKICREQFVRLHSQPILEDLSKFLQQNFSDKETNFLKDGTMDESGRKHLQSVLRRLPRKGDFVLSNVLDSVYFFC